MSAVRGVVYKRCADRQGKKDERQGAMGKRGERRERRDGNLLIGFLSELLDFCEKISK